MAMSCGLCRCVSGGWANWSAPLDGENPPSSLKDSVRNVPDLLIQGSLAQLWLQAQHPGVCLARVCGLLQAFPSRLKLPSRPLIVESGLTAPLAPPVPHSVGSNPDTSSITTGGLGLAQAEHAGVSPIRLAPTQDWLLCMLL